MCKFIALRGIKAFRLTRLIMEKAQDPVEMQNEFDKMDGTRMLLTVLSESNTSLIANDLPLNFLTFGVTILDEGNTRVQQTIFHYCQNFQRSEMMFAKFNIIISEEIQRLNSRNEIGHDELQSLILENTLRFLQLFTEGHYLDLQNYIRQQTNSRTNYDMVSLTVELLRSYHRHMNEKTYENIVKCLDTLNEFV